MKMIHVYANPRDPDFINLIKIFKNGKYWGKFNDDKHFTKNVAYKDYKQLIKDYNEKEIKKILEIKE